MNKLIAIPFFIALILLVIYIDKTTARENVEGSKLVTKIVDGDKFC